MGMFDSLYVPCPSCLGKVEFQSKEGYCQLDSFTIETAPSEILMDVLNKARCCRLCGQWFALIDPRVPPGYRPDIRAAKVKPRPLWPFTYADLEEPPVATTPSAPHITAALVAAKREIEWWADEHSCCSGHETGVIEKIDAALALASANPAGQDPKQFHETGGVFHETHETASKPTVVACSWPRCAGQQTIGMEVSTVPESACYCHMWGKIIGGQREP